jgi:hypothetical protein
MGNLHARGTSAGQYFSYEEFSIGGIESAAPNVNHDGKVLFSGDCDDLGDLAAFYRTSDIHGKSREV